MEANIYTIYNQTREIPVSNGVRAVNSAREPLTALRVMVEGLGAGEETGLWLTQVTVIPMVPRLSPFDLVYLDADDRIVACVELLPTAEIPRFKKPASSALVLPFRTISTTQIANGDLLILNEIAKPELEALPTETGPDESAPQATDEKAAPMADCGELTIFEVSEPAPDTQPSFLNPFLSSEATAAPVDLAAPVSAPDVPVFIAGQDRRESAFDLSDFLRTSAASSDVSLREPEEDITPKPVADRLSDIPPAASNRRRRRAVVDWSPQQSTPQATAQTKKPVDRFFRWLYPALYDHNRRTTERRPSGGLVAYELTSDTPRMHEVANFSNRGIYLRTEERWEPGTVVPLTLQPCGPFEVESTLKVDFDCGVVRAGVDGVGMSLVLPAGLELKLWEAPGRNGSNENDPVCVVRELRMARALAFMRRICPSADAQITESFHKTLSNVRAQNLVEVTLRAERILAQEPNAHGMTAHPDLVLKVVEYGSWVDADWLQELWAGLLATSCTLEGRDDSNLVYINLLSKLSPLPTQILTMSCAKAMQSMLESAAASPARLACSAEELARITRSGNLVKIYKSIGELSELGLLEKIPRSASPANPGEAKAMPTQLGLEMFARCNGQRDVSMAA